MSGDKRGAKPVPDGFRESRSGGPFTARNGPYFERYDTAPFRKGFFIEEKHLNGIGITHGGMLMAFADNICATAAYLESRSKVMTIRMTTDFLSAARPGEWLEGTAEVVRLTKSLAFVDGRGYVGERPIFRVSAVFKVLTRHTD